MKQLIKAQDANPNYLATVCQVGEVYPIEGADRLVKTVINGYDIVISKDFVPGDIVIYFPVETCICEKFLSANNLYETGEFFRNSNAEEVAVFAEKAENAKLNGDEKTFEKEWSEVKARCGFFNKHGRVRILKLRGQYSQGFIVKPVSMINYDPELVELDWNSLIGTQFNMVGEEEFCWKFVPPQKEQPERLSGNQKIWKKRMKHLKRFNRLIEGQFSLHYDTQMLAEHIYLLKPDDIVTISVKCHGTSVIIANVLTNKESKFTKSYAKRRIKGVMRLRGYTLPKRVRNEMLKNYIKYKTKPTKEYGNIYASRNTIKNQYINPSAQSFYKVDIWGCVNRDFSPYLENGMTVYGEIVGYLEGCASFIQKNHDYGCAPGHWKFMPYRITMTSETGEKTEWNVGDVYEWTMKLIAEHPELTDKVLPINILYHGRLGDLYPELDTETHWHENLLAKMKSDTQLFGMELDEPLCKNKVPREGIVVRIDNDGFSRAWKLKTLRHYGKEAEQHDKGEVDIEETA